MTNTLAPIEHADRVLLAWNSTLDCIDVPLAWLHRQDHVVTLCLHLGNFPPPSLPTPPTPPTCPSSCNVELILVHTFKKLFERA